MPNNPIQVVLNANDYQIIPDAGGGGSAKDFYEGRDLQFAEHKSRLLNELEQVRDRLNRPGRPALEYVHVTLNDDALAKTKRPTLKVFPPAQTPIVGGSHLGDMIVELTSQSLDFVRASISSAEIEVPLVRDKNTKEFKPKPSRARSEVGAIGEIRIHRAADRRQFSAQDAVQWFTDPRSGGMYLVDTFIDPRSTQAPDSRRLRANAIAAYEALRQELAHLDLPLEISDTGERWQTLRLMLLRLNSDDVEVHERLLRLLDEHPIVRRVSLPPIVAAEKTVEIASGEEAKLSAPDSASTYPVLGIIDTGVSAWPPLEQWCIGRTDPFGTAIQDRSHGTFIAGLSAAAHELNSHPIFGEIPCKFFDLGLHPTQENVYEDFYPRGFIDFLEQVDAEISAATALGVRIFNMSLSIQRPVADDGYSDYAVMLDEIADKHNIVVVLPAGNLDQNLWRAPWPHEPEEVAPMLASYRHAGQDRIFQPAESVRAISVGAMDLPDSEGRLRPTIYTRRGPSTALGVKPDIAHVGGAGQVPDLVSITDSGASTLGCGTSYAAPIAAKTLAALNHLIEGNVDRHTLVGLLIHHASLPPSLDHVHSSRYALDFVGHGLPAQALDMLVTDDSAITLAFIGTMQASRKLEFKFTWPAGLVSASGTCGGRARLTLVYQAPIDRQFGAEYVRVNMDAYLRQENIDTKTGQVAWKGRLASTGKIYERHLIEHGHKWWPIKHYERTISDRGVGNSSQWQLVVDSLCRTDTDFPTDGIPFAVILTIEDPGGSTAVFNELRQSLQSSGARIADIRTAQQITTRTR